MEHEYQHFERACELLKRMFLELRRVHFWHLVLTITPQSRARWKGIHANDDNKIHMFISKCREKSSQSRHAHDTIAMDALKDTEHEVVRSYDGSMDVVTLMQGMTRKVFDGVVSPNTAINEVELQIRPDKWTVVKHDSENNNEVNPKDVDRSHVLLKITYDGEEYAVDPAGAECGNFKAVLPWEEFVNTFAREKQIRAWIFGTSRQKSNNLAADEKSPSWEAEMRHREVVAGVMESAVERWEMGHMTVRELLGSSADVYKRDVDSLNVDVRDAVEACIQTRPRRVYDDNR